MRRHLCLLLASLLLLNSHSQAASDCVSPTCHVYTEVSVLPCETVYLPNETLPWGTEKTVQEGSSGSMTRCFSLQCQGRQYCRRSLLSVKTSAPSDEIIEYGTRCSGGSIHVKDYSGGVLERDGRELPYRYCLRLTATAYTAGEENVDEVTATGTLVHRGVVAVDRRVIPLGSTVYVETTDDVPSYGLASAEDTGVCGNAIDLYMEDYASCISFGRREVDVYVLA